MASLGYNEFHVQPIVIIGSVVGMTIIRNVFWSLYCGHYHH